MFNRCCCPDYWCCQLATGSQQPGQRMGVRFITPLLRRLLCKKGVVTRSTIPRQDLSTTTTLISWYEVSHWRLKVAMETNSARSLSGENTGDSQSESPAWWLCWGPGHSQAPSVCHTELVNPSLPLTTTDTHSLSSLRSSPDSWRWTNFSYKSKRLRVWQTFW